MSALPMSPARSDRVEGPTTASASGPLPYRVLVADAEPTAGPDVAALTDALAFGLAERTGHGVDVEAVESRPHLGLAARRVLPDRDLGHVDAVVVVLDPDDDAPTAHDVLRRTTEDLAARLTVGAALVLVVPPSRTGATGTREQDLRTDAALETVGALTRVVRLGSHADSTQEERIERWAAEVADGTASALIDPIVRFVSHDPFDELDRVETVRGIGRRYAEWVGEFQDLVEAARSTYHTASAAMSIIDDETTRYFARSGNVAVSLPRGKTVCNRVMRIYGGLILGDARLDHRFSGLPEVKTGVVRFYAGYRITGPDGAPFGALCVFDDEPRDVRDEDLVALRDLAVGAQRHLWSLLPTSSAD